MSLIRSLERLTRTDLVYLASGGFWITIGQVVSSVAALLLAVAFANLLPVATYGKYRYLLSIAGFFSVFTLPGMVTALTRAVAQGGGGEIHAATRARLLASIVGCVAALSGALYYFVNQNYELATGLALIALTLPIFDTFTLYGGYLAGKRDFKTQTLYHFAMQAVSVIALLVTLLLTDNVLIILAAYFLPLAVVRFVLYRRVSRTAPSGSIHTPETLVYGTHLSAMNVLSVASQTIDKLLLWHFLGPIELAVYTFALAIPEQLKGPLKGVGDLALPKFSARTHTEMARSLPLLWYRMALYGGVLLVAALLYALIAPYFFQLLFPQYLASVPYSQLFALSMVSGITVVPMAALSAQKKTLEQYALTIAYPVLQIALFVTLIPPYGILGAIVALLVARAIVTVFVIVTTWYTFREEGASSQ